MYSRAQVNASTWFYACVEATKASGRDDGHCQWRRQTSLMEMPGLYPGCHPIMHDLREIWVSRGARLARGGRAWWAGRRARRFFLVSEVVRPSQGRRFAIVAHRGDTSATSAADPRMRRENTLAAFSAARRVGVDGVELDVRRSADGVVVVVHDAVLADGRVVTELDHEQLPPWLPTLDEALDACGAMLVDIEVKNAPTEPGFDPEQRVADEVMATLARRAARVGSGSWIATSFWPDTVAALSAARAQRSAGALDDTKTSPRCRLGLLLHRSLDPSGLVERTVALGCDTLLPWWEQVSSGWVSDAHRAGLAVMAWTVNGAAALSAVVAAGVDAVITDEVDAALSFRRHWDTSRSQR